MPKLRVLILSQYFWPEIFRINDVAHGLRDLGHEVSVLTGLPNYPEGRLFKGYGWFGPLREDYAGIPVCRVPLITRGGGGGLRLALNYLSFVVSAIVFGLPRLRCTHPDYSPLDFGFARQLPRRVHRRRNQATGDHPHAQQKLHRPIIERPA